MSQTGQSFDWLQFHLTLKRAGITKQRAAFQSRIGVLVENVAHEIVEMSGSESYYDWMMTGSFVEGWGNHLFRLDGVTGADSDIDWSQVVNHKIYHLKKTCKSVVDCINRKDYELDNGHIQVKNCSQQPAFSTERHGLRPETDECHAYPCCSYPETVLGDDGRVDRQEVYPAFRDLLTKHFDNENPVDDVHFVRASVPGQANQMRLSCTRQERTIMSQLSTVHGQLFTVLKYLFKTDVRSGKKADHQSESSGKHRANKHKGETRIVRYLKSFHAKTLLMTLLREKDNWLEEGRDEDQDEKAAAELLKNLVCNSLKSLQKSATDNAKSGENAGNGEKVIPPKVLDHALLLDAGLYLKVKTEDKDKGKTKISDKHLHKLHVDALKQLAEDLQNLMENELETVLSEYKHQVERTLDKRGIPKVGISPPDAETETTRQRIVEPEIARTGTAGAQESLENPMNHFLFVPLLMLPRINLETLLEEMDRKKSQTAPSPDAPAQALPDVPPDAPALSTLPPESGAITDSNVGSGVVILKYAYIYVWRILTSLATQKNGTSQQEDSQLEKAWKWVEKQACLQTTHQCLKVMRLMKENAPESQIFDALNIDYQPVRWISLGDDLDSIPQEKNCLWAFHYFIRPNVQMNFRYLDSVQAVWKTAKTSVYEENSVKCEFVTESGCCVRKSWLTHLEVKEDSKNSRQPSLTVNFDGLLDSFRRWMHMRKGSKSEELGGGDFLAFMDNCLFDPRASEQELR